MCTSLDLVRKKQQQEQETKTKTKLETYGSNILYEEWMQCRTEPVITNDRPTLTRLQNHLSSLDTFSETTAVITSSKTKQKIYSLRD